jgi:SSS family solute:Na+ symporter
MLAGFFLKSISATGAKAALFFGLSFYIITTFILKVDIHFIHIWGIEFVLNMIIMFAVSYYYPRKTFTDKADAIKIDMKSWKYAKHLSIALVIITILIYILLGQN